MTERVLPPNFKHKIETTFLRRLTWKERLQVALGYNLQIDCVTLIEHKPGKFEPKMNLRTTPRLKGDNA